MVDPVVDGVVCVLAVGTTTYWPPDAAGSAATSGLVVAGGELDDPAVGRGRRGVVSGCGRARGVCNHAGMSSGPRVQTALAQTEQWFVRHGMPHFIVGFSPSRAVLTRALPALAGLLPLQLLADVALAPSWRRRAVGLVLAVATVSAVALLAGRLRGRPWRRLPARAQREWLAVFVGLGPVLALLLGAGWRLVALAAVGNLALVGTVYLATTFGLVSVAGWTARRTLYELSEIGALAGRGLPMLVLFGVLTFFSSDLWRVASALSTPRLLLVVGFFVLLTVVFLLVKLPDELDRLPTALPAEQVRAACAGTPLAGALDGALDGAAPQVRSVTLEPAHRVNMVIYLLLCQLIQVSLLSTVVWVFFGVFGSVAVRPEVMAEWLGQAPQPAHAFGAAVPGLSRAVLHTTTLLSSLAAFYFTVSAVTDAVYREEFFSRTLAELTRMVGVRCGYLTLRGGSADPSTGPS
jgi:hypothetical protein